MYFFQFECNNAFCIVVHISFKDKAFFLEILKKDDWEGFLRSQRIFEMLCKNLKRHGLFWCFKKSVLSTVSTFYKKEPHRGLTSSLKIYVENFRSHRQSQGQIPKKRNLLLDVRQKVNPYVGFILFVLYLLIFLFFIWRWIEKCWLVLVTTQTTHQ